MGNGMEKENNMKAMVNYHLKENLRKEKNGMDGGKNSML